MCDTAQGDAFAAEAHNEQVGTLDGISMPVVYFTRAPALGPAGKP
jgi:hypothetical protein